MYFLLFPLGISWYNISPCIPHLHHGRSLSSAQTREADVILSLSSGKGEACLYVKVIERERSVVWVLMLVWQERMDIDESTPSGPQKTLEQGWELVCVNVSTCMCAREIGCLKWGYLD